MKTKWHEAEIHLIVSLLCFYFLFQIHEVYYRNSRIAKCLIHVLMSEYIMKYLPIIQTNLSPRCVFSPQYRFDKAYRSVLILYSTFLYIETEVSLFWF